MEITQSKLFFRPSEKGHTLKGKNLLPGSKFFLFIVCPFPVTADVKKVEQEVIKVVSFAKHGGKSTSEVHQIPL